MEWMRLVRRVKMAACTGEVLLTAALLMDMEAKNGPVSSAGRFTTSAFTSVPRAQG